MDGSILWYRGNTSSPALLTQRHRLRYLVGDFQSLCAAEKLENNTNPLSFWLRIYHSLSTPMTLFCLQQFSGKTEEEEVRVLEKGDYFGEQALLKEECRSANVIALPPGVECLTLGRE